MRKSILRFGALALMSLTSIGAFAQGFTEFECDGNTYKIITNDPSQTDASKAGTVKLIKWTSGNVGIERVNDSFGNDYIVTEIQGNEYNGAHGARSKDGAFLQKAPSITIGPDVTTIEPNAFKEINGNATITLANPSKLTTLGEYAFTPATEKSVTLSLPIEVGTPAISVLKLDPTAQIAKGAFAGVTFPANTRVELGTVTAVKEELFADSKNLKYVLFEGSNNLQEVEAGAFKGCNSIVWFGYYENVNNAHFIPSSLRTVGASAFAGASAITEFKFSVTAKETNSVINKVGASAFEGCTWLDNAHFCNLFPADLGVARGGGDYVTVRQFEFGNLAFAHTHISGCYDFQNVSVNTFSNAFSQNINLNVVILYPDTKTIAAGALQGCTSLEKCDLPSGLETINALAFENTTAFTSVFIPSSVEFIGKDAFSRGGSFVDDVWTYNESSLGARTITIQPKEATSATETSKVIMSYKQTGTTQQGAPIYARTAPIADYSKTTLVVPMGLMNSYAKMSDVDHKRYDWSGAAEDFDDGNDGVQSHLCTYEATNSPIYIGKYKFTVNPGWNNYYTTSGCKEAPEVTLAGINTTAPAQNGSTLPYGETLYQKISNVASAKNFDLMVPQTICRPGENNANKFVWYNVTAVEKMSTIGDGLFTDLSKNVTKAQVQADKIDLLNVFSSCSNLTSFEFCGLTMKNAYYQDANHKEDSEVGKTGWAGATAAPTEAAMNDNAFSGCVSLYTFNGVTSTFKYTQARVGGSAFLNCPLTSVVIPDNVKYIAPSAYNGTKITEVTLPGSLLEIYDYAFANTQLTSVNIPASVEKIGAYAFDGGSKPVKNELGVTIDGQFVGVADVYVNWTIAPPTAVQDDPDTETDETVRGIDPLAFGDATSVMCGTQPKYILRSLYTPDGSTYASAPFNDGKKFVISEAIIAKGGEYKGRIDVTLNRETNYRELNITDENQITEFKISNPAANILVNYIRKAAVGMANPLFVPFEIEQKADAKYQIAKVFDTKVDPKTGKESIEYVNLKVGEMTKANVPYVFFPKEAVVIFNAVGYSKTSTVTELNSPLVTCSNAKNEYEFYGTYDEKAADEYYVLTSGNRFAKNDGDNAAPLKALRFYMTSGHNANWNYIKINVLDDEEVTAIENVKANSLNAPMFDLQGRQIAAPAKGQVYIQNGVKKLAR